VVTMMMIKKNKKKEEEDNETDLWLLLVWSGGWLEHWISDELVLRMRCGNAVAANSLRPGHQMLMTSPEQS